MPVAQTLICTVGTSLFFPNLAGLKPEDPSPERRALGLAYSSKDRRGIASGLMAFPPTERLCGAEINSLASLFAKGYAVPDGNLYFCHSATKEGREIAEVLALYYKAAGHHVAEAIEVADLQDDDPRRFRTKGLRNLAKVVCRVIRDHGAESCAINATGGYKAQIAIAVLMGQALGVPVYYKHERFDEIIAFPPMPVSLNFEVWMRASGILFTLDRDGVGPASLLDDYPEDAETLEGLVERVEIDEGDFLELSAAGQVFHETFRQRFQSRRPDVLPPPIPPSEKAQPRLEDGHLRAHPEILRHLETLTREVPQIRRCVTTYYNPDLPGSNRFRVGPHGVVGIFSDGRYTVKFAVESSAQTDAQRAAVAAALNEWMEARR